MINIVRFFNIFTVLIGASLLALVSSCTNTPGNPSTYFPSNVEIRINEGEEATNDSVLTVHIYGDDIHRMQLSLDSTFASATWEDFLEYNVMYVEREDGILTVFGRFTAAGGGTTATVSDDIKLDFTAVIDSVAVSVKNDPVYAGDMVRFDLWTSETGLANVKYTSIGIEVQMNERTRGHFEADVEIPQGINESDVVTVGSFIDEVGNIAEPDTALQRINIAGSRLSPVIVSRLPLEGSFAFDVVYRADHCLVSDTQAVHVINVLEPESPELLRTVDAGSWNGKIFASSDRLYVPNRHGIAVLNIEPVSNTRLLDNLAVSGMPRDVRIYGDYAFVACFHEGLKILDLRVISEPLLIGEIRTQSYGERVLVNEQAIFLFGGGGGQTLHLGDNAEPDTIGNIEYVFTPKEVELYNDYIVMAADAGLYIYDGSDPTNVFELQHVDTDTFALSVEILPPYLFVGGNNHFISIYNLTIHDELEEIGRIEGAGAVQGMCIYDDMMYAVRPETLFVIDLFVED